MLIILWGSVYSQEILFCTSLYRLNKAWKRSFQEGLLPFLFENIELVQHKLEIIYKDYLELCVPKNMFDKIHETAFVEKFEELKILSNSKKSTFKALRERNSELIKLITTKIKTQIEEGQIEIINHAKILETLCSIISCF